MKELIDALTQRLWDKSVEYEKCVEGLRYDVEHRIEESLFEKNEMGVLSNMEMLKGEIKGIRESLALVEAYANSPD